MPTVYMMSPAQIRAGVRASGWDAQMRQPYARGCAGRFGHDDTEQALLIVSRYEAGASSSGSRVSWTRVEFAHALLAWED